MLLYIIVHICGKVQKWFHQWHCKNAITSYIRRVYVVEQLLYGVYCALYIIELSNNEGVDSLLPQNSNNSQCSQIIYNVPVNMLSEIYYY